MFLGVGHRINELLNSQHFVNSTNTCLDIQGSSTGDVFKEICFTFATINPKLRTAISYSYQMYVCLLPSRP